MKTVSCSLEEAYEYCRAITQKRESNFSLGFPLLPPEKNRAIHVVYAFCRFVDDISDEVKTGNVKDLLDTWERELENIYEQKRATHPIGIALLDTLKTFPIPREGFQDLIDGCIKDQEMKVYPTFERLTEYCDLVATSIAKVSLPVYGFKLDPAVISLGRDLSFAFQLTNILRDVSEDFHRGRVYLPSEDLKRFGLGIEELIRGEKPEAMLAFYQEQGQRCEAYFQSGRKVLQYLEPESRPCVHVMWGAYHTLLEKILKDPLRSLSSQTVLSKQDKQSIVEELGRVRD